MIKRLRVFDGFIEILTKYPNDKLNDFIGSNSSGFVEGLNNKFKVIKRRYDGMVNIKDSFQRVTLHLEGCSLFLSK